MYTNLFGPSDPPPPPYPLVYRRTCNPSPENNPRANSYHFRFYGALKRFASTMPAKVQGRRTRQCPGRRHRQAGSARDGNTQGGRDPGAGRGRRRRRTTEVRVWGGGGL